MLSIHLDINGRRIGAIGVHNEQVMDGDRDRYGIYDLRQANVGDTMDDVDRIGEVWHDRDDGATTLTALVMEEVDEDEYIKERRITIADER